MKMSWALSFFLMWARHYASGLFMLPADIIPKHYNLTLIYDIDPETNFSLFGVVEIMLEAALETSEIVLFAQDITLAENKIKLTSVSSTTLKADNNTNDFLSVKDIIRNTENQYYTLHLTKRLVPNNSYILSIPFFGNLGTKQSGAYVIQYMDKKTNKVEYYVKTSFEPTNARQCFPCFDEPQYKATFTVTLGHHKDYRSISNMPRLVDSSRINALDTFFPWTVMEVQFLKTKDNFVWDDFEISKPMSTHLVAFMISKYVDVVSSPRDRIGSTAWARPEVAHQASYAASVSAHIVSYYELFFNISFPSRKLDHVFEYVYVPVSTSNFGLISYPENLLFDKNNFRKNVKLDLVNSMSREVSHQWFGNLVTLKYWNENWLKEGIAIFMGHLSLKTLLLEKHLRKEGSPGERTWLTRNFTRNGYLPNTFVDLFVDVLKEDALTSAQAMSLPIDVTGPKKIFNALSNNKAAILFRMLYRFMGEKDFKKALKKFLLQYSYGSFFQYDLWDVMDQSIDTHKITFQKVSIKEVMNSWTKQPGYPLITVIRDYDTRTITVTQQRFLATDEPPGNSSWWIPLCVLIRGDDQQSELPIQWLPNNNGNMVAHQFVHGAHADEWLLLNAHVIALYRVNYDVRSWDMLSTALRSSDYQLIPALSRALLLSDSFAMARKGLLDYTIALKLAKYLDHEEDSIVLQHGLEELIPIDALFRRTADYEIFQKYVRAIVENHFKKYDGLNSTNIIHNDINKALLQKYISKWACDMNVARCLLDAEALFRKWMATKEPDKNNPISVDLRDTVYCWGVALGTIDQWRFMLERAYNASSSEKAEALNALACTREASLMQRTINVIISGDFSEEMLTSVISTLIRNPVGFYIVADFFYKRPKRNISTEVQKTLITTLIHQFISQEELNEFLGWRDKNAKSLEEMKLAINIAIDHARNNFAWINKNQEMILRKLTLLSKDESRTLMSLRENSNKAGKIVFTKLNVISILCYMYLVSQIHDIDLYDSFWCYFYNDDSY